MNFSYFQLADIHFKDVQYLIKAVFGKQVSIQHLKNKYKDYLNLGYISTIAYDDQQPIGFYGAIPQEFIHNGQEIIVAHACDSYTLKEYQGKGVHYNLAKIAYSIMKDKHVRFVYAFHSDNTYHSTKKLDWKERERIVRFHVNVNTFPFAKVYKKLKLKKQLQSKIVKELKPYKINEVEYKSNLSHQIFNPTFFEYKDNIQPHHLIEVEGCVFYIKIDAIMQVGFFTFDNYEKLEIALEKLKEIGQNIGVNEILFQVSENSEMYKGLKGITPPQPSWIIGYLTFQEIDFTHFEFTYANLDTF
jgi:GNAT superfamily N-acetyltransferase